MTQLGIIYLVFPYCLLDWFKSYFRYIIEENI
nr:MAG TPA: hypothetical protein [Caudoviricetes sp.]